MTQITDGDRQKAREIYGPPDGELLEHHALIDRIAAALAEAREEAEASLRKRMQEATEANKRGFEALTEARARIAELEQRLRVADTISRGKILKMEGVIRRKNADLSALEQERDRLREAVRKWRKDAGQMAEQALKYQREI